MSENSEKRNFLNKFLILFEPSDQNPKMFCLLSHKMKMLTVWKVKGMFSIFGNTSML